MYRHPTHQRLSFATLDAVRVQHGGECDRTVPGHSAKRGHEFGDDDMARLVAADTGRRVHKLLGQIAHLTDVDVAEVTDRLLLAEPVPGAVRSSIRWQVASAANVYMQRLRPLDARLIGVEVPLDGCRADLVWEHIPTGLIVIDEVKTRGQVLTTKQIRNLVAAGYVQWPGKFIGVRRCATQQASQTVLLGGSPYVQPRTLPTWLEVR